MKISILQIGSTSSGLIKELCNEYLNRLKKYAQVEVITIPDVKDATNMDSKTLKKKEWELISAKTPPGTVLILLDEKGKEFTSTEFSTFIQKQQNASVKSITFVIGGAFGFDQQAYDKANAKISLSKLTFSHQMVRLIFLEQLYRAHTILKGEKYHHE